MAILFVTRVAAAQPPTEILPPTEPIEAPTEILPPSVPEKPQLQPDDIQSVETPGAARKPHSISDQRILIPPSDLAPQLIDEPTLESESSRTSWRWYGWQTLLMDGGAVGMWSLGFSNGQANGPLLLGGTLVYLLGAPAIHNFHDHPGKAIASLGLRVGVPLAGGLIGSMAGSRDDEYGTADDMVAGVIFGFLLASVIDAAALAHEQVRLRPRPPPAIGLAPSFSKERKNLGLQLVGVF